MPSSVPFRDTFWNVPGWAQVVLYIGGAVAIAIFVYGVWQRVQLWRAGLPENRFDHLPQRVKLVAKHALGQVRPLSQAYPGVMHAVMFWGFLALFMGTVLATIDYDITLPLFGYKLLKGDFYLFYETVLDLFGLFFVIGLGMAVWRRFVVRPPNVDPTGRFAAVLALLFVINVTGFVMEAARLAVVQPAWARWSPVGYALGQAMLAAGMSEAALRSTHLAVWIFHALLALGFIAIVPYSYFVHLITTPLNIFFAKLTPRGAIAAIPNIEEAEALGVSKLEEFSWKRRLDFDACVECGRCQAACPAYLSGTALSPKRIIVKLKRHLHGELAGPIHGELIKPEELWACTTCMACVQECPAFIDIVDTIIDLRRYLALSEGALPSTAPQSLQNIQRAGNPWGLPAGERLAWAEGLDVPLMEPGKEVEYLYWVGCSASYDRRNQAIARAVVKILKSAGVSFAVMQESAATARSHAASARSTSTRRSSRRTSRRSAGTGSRRASRTARTASTRSRTSSRSSGGTTRSSTTRSSSRSCCAPGASGRRSRSTPRSPSTTRATSGATMASPRRRGTSPARCRGSASSSFPGTAPAASAAAGAAATCGWRSRRS